MQQDTSTTADARVQVWSLWIDRAHHHRLVEIIQIPDEQQLATERFTEAQLRRVLDALYPAGTDGTASDRTRRSREQTKHRIIELFAHGETQGNAPGTKWAAINAIIEHADWIRPLNAGSQRFARVLDDGSRKTHALELVGAA